MAMYSLGREWKQGDRTFHALTRQQPENDGSVS
jgi:hypothetical protein